MYEITFIVNDEKDADTLKDLLTAADGKIVNEKKWGKRAFSYPIQKMESGSYITWTVEVTEPKMKELKSKMTFNEKLVRFLILKVNDSEQPQAQV